MISFTLTYMRDLLTANLYQIIRNFTSSKYTYISEQNDPENTYC